jgi:DNA-binding transcriptional MerR regulator
VTVPELPPLETLRDAAWNLEDFVAEVNTRLPTMLPVAYDDARQREDFSVRLLRHYGSLGLVDESERVGREARYRYRHLLQVLCLRRLQREGWNSKAIAGFITRPDAELEAFLLGYATQTLEDRASEGATQKPAEKSAEKAEHPLAESEAWEEAMPLSAAIAAPEDFKLEREITAPAPPRSAPPLQKKITPPRQERDAKSALEFLDRVRSRSQTRGTQQMPAPAPLPQFLLHDPPKAPEQWRRVEIAPGLELHISNTFRKARTTVEKDRLRDALENALEE